jgi:glutamine synthetase
MLLGQFNDEMANMCPRALLSRALDKLVDLGYQVFGGYELECTPLAETPDSLQTKSPAAVELASGFTSVYSFVHESMQEALFADLLDSSSVMDVEVDSIHSEFVNMIEVGLKPQRGLRMADNAALYKSIAKIVGKRHNLQMSFMAMLNNAGQSSGAHLNLSLRDQQDGKAFFDDSAEDNVSQVQRFFIGGMQRHLPELFLMLVPNLNSFKRFAPGQFAPKTNTWGINNKTVAHRVINLSAASSRIETRIAGADVNPYLALLAVVTAGRLGIQNEVEPEDPVEGNGMEAQDDNPFPENFTDAIEKFKSSGMAKAELGEAFVNGFASDRQWQIDQFNQSVTDWELRMFYDV